MAIDFRKRILPWMFVLNGLPILLACQRDNRPQDGQGKSVAEMTAKLREKIGNKDVRIDFYAKVVDQFDQPVEGAEITLTLVQYNPVAWPFTKRDKRKVRTDAQGRFGLRNEIGSEVMVSPVLKKGYEFVFNLNQNNDDFFYSGYTPPFVPDPNHSIIYRLRKLGETTFLYRGGGGFNFEVQDSGKEQALDLIRGHLIQEKDFRNPQYLGEPLVCDLKAKATWDPKTRTWSVMLSVGTPGGGLQLSDQLLYEAPKEGYQPGLKLAPKEGTPKTRYLYIRGRTPFIYTRMDLGGYFDVNGRYFVRKNDDPDTHFEIGGSATINPYGERNLEAAPNLSSEIQIALEKEIKDAYRYNPDGRPAKPNLQQRIQEWEKNRPLTEKLKGMFKR